MALESRNYYFYQYNDEYGIEIFEVEDCGEELWESWLVEKHYGLKSFLVGLLKKDCPTAEDFLDIVLNDIDFSIELFEESKVLYDSDPDLVLNKPDNEMLNEVLERTLRNCGVLEREGKSMRLLNEIGCVRGVVYSIEKLTGRIIMNKTIGKYLDYEKDMTKLERED